MALQHQLELLQRVAAASTFESIDILTPQLSGLIEWAEQQSDRGTLRKYIEGHEIVRDVYNAANNCLIKISGSCTGAFKLLPAVPAAFQDTLALCDLCLPTEPPTAPVALMKRIKSQIMQTDFLKTFAATCSGVAEAIIQHTASIGSSPAERSNSTQRSSRPSNRKRTAGRLRCAAEALADAHSAVLGLAQMLTILWTNIKAVWGHATEDTDCDGKPYTVLAFDPHFSVSIAPMSNLTLAVLRYYSSAAGALGNVHTGPLTALRPPVEDAVGVAQTMSLMLFLEINRARSEGGRWQADDPDPATAAVKDVLKSGQLQELLLFFLAINMQILYQKQQGVTLVSSLEPVLVTGAAATDGTSSKSRAGKRARSQQQQQPVQDHCSELLQLLGLSGTTPELYPEYIHVRDTSKGAWPLMLHSAISVLDQAFRQSKTLPAPWQQQQQPSSCDKTASLHLVLMELLLQQMLLEPKQRAVYDAVRFMEAVMLTLTDAYWHRIIAQHTPSAMGPAAQAAAVADSFLAQLVLKGGTVVLFSLKQPEPEGGLKADLQEEWGFLLRVMLKAGLITEAAAHKQRWSDMFLECPFTTCAAVELAIRASGKGGVSQQAPGLLIQHIPYILEAAAGEQKLLDAVAAAGGERRAAGIPAFDTKSLAAQPFSLLASSAKYCGLLIEASEDCMGAYELAMVLADTAKKFAATSCSEGAAAAAPWVHLAARALSCCGKVLLWPHRAGTAEDEQAWLELQHVAQQVAEEEMKMLGSDSARKSESSPDDSDSATHDSESESAKSESSMADSSDESSASAIQNLFPQVKLFGSPFDGLPNSYLSESLQQIAAIAGWCCDQVQQLSSSGGCNGSVNTQPSDSASAAAAGALVDLAPAELLQQLQHQSQQLQQELTAAVQKWEGESSDWWAPEVSGSTGCWDMFVAARQVVGYQTAQLLQQYGLSLAAQLPTVLCCNNPGCHNMGDGEWPHVSEVTCVGKSRCSRCKAAGYCSRECQAQHWSQHKKVCAKFCHKPT